MAIQICPKCGVKAITWSIDEEASPLTNWGCRGCGHVAEEDESRAVNCPRCSAEKMFALVKDCDGFHRWCCSCGSFENTLETFAKTTDA
jgi:hypothetical protein